MSAFTIHTNIEGNLTSDPELRFTSNGLPVCNMRVAVNSRRRLDNGELVERTEYITVVAWRDMATHAAASLVKGHRVMVGGNIKERSYTNREGNTVYVRELHADSLGVSLRWHVVAGIEKANEALAQPELEPVEA